jgi:hypothetical protein
MYLALLLTILLVIPAVSFGEDRPAVTVWLIPAENAGPGDMARGEEIRERVDRFNNQFLGTPITVENTTDPVLKMKLMSWNPAFAVPNASVVVSQKRILRALQEFAERKNVRIRVRFVNWDEAFGLISDLNPERRSGSYPDVIQIGSTWSAYLAKHGLIMSRPDRERDRGNWKDVLDLPASSLPYITDVRLLFYWKRLPSVSPDSREFVLNTSSWNALVDSIRQRATSSDTIAFPTGLTLNVLHDYAPLVWAGGGGFLAHGWFGQRVELTSAKALAIPEFLQRSALEMPRPGEPRRLITFPESSHEEVDRVFVNGGYRITQEPANFIDRWRQDFAQRHQKDGLRFWDYAAAAVPPKAFRGGSELVVMRGCPTPDTAFSVADFLAGDPSFTTILAEAGHLPSGRRGYGTDILATSLSPGSTPPPEVEQFVDAVQKAIEQGVSYPQFAEWPIAIENARVQEAMQVVWRRMGEGDPEKLNHALRNAEWTINSQIYWPDELRKGVIEARWALLTILLMACLIAGYFIYRREQAQRALMLSLSLYRAHRHDAAKFLGTNLYGLADDARREGWAASKLIERLLDVSTHFKDRLVKHIERIAINQQKEMYGKPSTMRLNEVTDIAFDGARYIYEAKELKTPPDIHYANDGLERFNLQRLPFALVVVLEEWFLNSTIHIVGNRLEQPVFLLKLIQRELSIESTGSIDARHLAILREKPRVSDLSSHQQGLNLIRNIMYYAYGAHVRAENTTSSTGQPRIKLYIPLGSNVTPI